MRIKQVDIVELESFERCVSALDNMFPGETPVVGSFTAPKELCGDDEVSPLPAEFADCYSHVDLALAARVDLFFLGLVLVYVGYFGRNEGDKEV